MQFFWKKIVTNYLPWDFEEVESAIIFCSTIPAKLIHVKDLEYDWHAWQLRPYVIFCVCTTGTESRLSRAEELSESMPKPMEMHRMRFFQKPWSVGTRPRQNNRQWLSPRRTRRNGAFGSLQMGCVRPDKASQLAIVQENFRSLTYVPPDAEAKGAW